VANISVERGTLVEEQRQKVVETIAAVNEGNASVKGGTLVMKTMSQIARESVPETTATESLAEPFRQPIAQEGESLRPQVRPEAMTMKTTEDQPKPEKQDVETKELLDDTATTSGVQSSAKKEDSPLNVRNNNLGNIKNIQANEWVGQTNLETDETFANFETPELGVRALTKVVQANINATNTFEEYVNRYASEPDEKDYYAKNGELMPHLKNYGSVIAASQGINNVKKSIPEDINMLEWLKATARAEGGEDALSYFTDDIIKKGIELVGEE
jgi:hypothetical protein